MKKSLTKIYKRVIKNALKENANSTSSYFCYQPKVPEKLKDFSKDAK